MPRRALVLVALLAAGCGGGSGEGTVTQETLSPDQREAGDIALRYVRAVARGDWTAVCETRTRSEQREMSRLGGSCETAMQAVFKGKPTDLFEKVRIGDVRVRGDVAGVDLVQPGQSEPVTTVAAVREGDRWRLEDVPDEKIP